MKSTNFWNNQYVLTKKNLFQKRIRDALELEDLESKVEQTSTSLNILDTDKFSHKGPDEEENGHTVGLLFITK